MARVAQGENWHRDLRPKRLRLVKFTHAVSLSKHVTHRDTLGRYSLRTGGSHEIGTQIYAIPSFSFLATSIHCWSGFMNFCLQSLVLFGR